MPNIPISHTEAARIITRDVAAKINCESLYLNVAQRTGTYNITITVQPTRTIDTPDGQRVISSTGMVLPRSPLPLSNFIPEGWDDIRLIVEYVMNVDGFNPEERMTLREFVIRTLDVWDRMYEQTGSYREEDKEAGAKLITAMEALKGTYSISEMLDTLPTAGGESKIDINQFKTYFDYSNKEEHAV